MTKAERDALRELELKATPGPWKIKNRRIVATKIYNGFASAVEPDPNDQELIVAARNALPGLLDRIEELEAALLKLVEMVNPVLDDAGKPHGPGCAWCNARDLLGWTGCAPRKDGQP